MVLSEYVYVIKCQDYYKIGKANNVDSRLRDLQVSNPYDLELIKTFEVDDGFRFEKFLHKTFKNKHSRGEWFKLSREDLVKIEKMDREEMTHAWQQMLKENPIIEEKIRDIAEIVDSMIKDALQK